MPSDRPISRPLALPAAAALLVSAAIINIVFAVLLFKQGDPYARALDAVDPTGPDNATLASEAHTGVRVLALFAILAAIALIVCAILLMRPVAPSIGGAARRIVTWVVAVLAVIYPVDVLLRGGVGLTIVAIPHRYDGSNAVHLRLADSFQSTAVTLEAIVAILLVAVIVLLMLPPVTAYLRKVAVRREAADFSSLLKRSES